MEEQDKEAFHKAIDAMFKLYLKPEPQNDVVGMYFGALSRYQLEEVTEAIGLHVMDSDTGQFLPKPADIIRHISGNKETRAELAWTKVDRTIREIGPHMSVCFDDALIHQVVEDMGGWVKLCATKDTEYPFTHNEFIKRYRGYIMRAPDQVMRRLVGIVEGGNSQEYNQTHNVLPVLVGDKTKALAILEGGRDTKRIAFHKADGLIGSVMKRIEETKPDVKQDG